MKKIIAVSVIIALIIYTLPILDRGGYLSKIRGSEIIGESELTRLLPGAKIVFEIDRIKPFIKNPDAHTEDSLKATLIDLRLQRDGRVTSDTAGYRTRFYKIVNNILSIYDPEPPSSIAESFKKKETTIERASELYNFKSAYNVYIVKDIDENYNMENTSFFCRTIIYFNPIIAYLNKHYDFQNPVIACSFPIKIRR